MDSGLKIELGHPRKSKRGRWARFRAADYEIHEGSLPEDKGGPNRPRETGKGVEGGGQKNTGAEDGSHGVREARANGPLIDRKEEDVRVTRKKKNVDGRTKQKERKDKLNPYAMFVFWIILLL